MQWQLWHSNKFLSVFYLGVRLCRSFPCPLLKISMIERYSLTFWGAYNTQNILEQLYCTFWMISSTRIKGPTIIFAHILHTLCLTHLWHIRYLNQHHMSYKLVKSFLSMCTSTSVWQQIETTAYYWCFPHDKSFIHWYHISQLGFIKYRFLNSAHILLEYMPKMAAPIYPQINVTLTKSRNDSYSNMIVSHHRTIPSLLHQTFIKDKWKLFVAVESHLT